MRRRTKILLGVAALVVVLGVVAILVGPPLYARWVGSTAEAPPTLTPVTGGTSSTASTVPPSSPAANVDGTWTIADGSFAGYRVDEVLRGENVTVTGRTDQVTGSVEVSGSSLTAAEVTVDVASISTPEPPRDAYFRDTAMQVSQFPTATFELTEPATFTDPVVGESQAVNVSGELTLHGVTRPVEARLEAVLAGDAGQVTGSIPITFADFGVEAPSFGFVSVEDEGAVEFLLNLDAP